MPHLTEDKYLARRAELEALLRQARDDHADEALALEVGDEGDRKKLERARASVSEIEDRLSGLEAAWAKSQPVIAAEMAAAAARKRREDRGRAFAILDDRVKVAAEIDQLVKQLGERWRAMVGAGQNALMDVHPYLQGHRSAQTVVDTFNFSEEMRWLAGALFNEGIQGLDKYDAIAASSAAGGTTLEAWSTRTTDAMRGWVGRLIHDAGPIADEA